MRVVLTGATGFVGSTVLDHLPARPGVERVTCLTRRAVPRADDPRVVPVLVDGLTFCYLSGLAPTRASRPACPGSGDGLRVYSFRPAGILPATTGPLARRRACARPTP